MTVADALHAAVAELAASSGLGEVVGLARLPGGGNNRAYRAETATGSVFVKEYFRDPADARDRLGAEFAFATFAWAMGVRSIPEPLASDPDRGIALFAFVDGHAPAASEVGERHVDEAVALLAQLNSRRDAPGAAQLPLASEACFSIERHLALVGRRVDRLVAEAEEPARGFVRERLVDAWAQLVRRVRHRATRHGLDVREELSSARRCLSPSDFGFHNVLVGAGSRLIFHDFEYAGWDDPAKLAGDFRCQPAVPVPSALAARFDDGLARTLELSSAERARAEVLGPVFRLKWCCIFLNEFLPDGRRHRRFTGSQADRDVHEQLDKASRVLDGMAEGHD